MCVCIFFFFWQKINKTSYRDLDFKPLQLNTHNFRDLPEVQELDGEKEGV